MSDEAYNDSARRFIADVMTELEALQGPIPYTVSRLEGQLPKDLPNVAWDYGRIKHGPPDFVGYNEGDLATEIQELLIEIWHDSTDNCRITKNNLLLALFHVGYAPNVTFGDFDWVTAADGAAYVTRGFLLRGSVTVKLGVPTQPAPLVTVTSHTHSITVNGETVC